jgi:hypothetical protein
VKTAPKGKVKGKVPYLGGAPLPGKGPFPVTAPGPKAKVQPKAKVAPHGTAPASPPQGRAVVPGPLGKQPVAGWNPPAPRPPGKGKPVKGKAVRAKKPVAKKQHKALGDEPCVAVAIAASLGVPAHALLPFCSGQPAGDVIEDVLDALTACGVIAGYWPCVPDLDVTGLIIGLDRHAALSAGGGLMWSWDQVMPVCGYVDEAWEIDMVESQSGTPDWGKVFPAHSPKIMPARPAVKAEDVLMPEAGQVDLAHQLSLPEPFHDLESGTSPEETALD